MPAAVAVRRAAEQNAVPVPGAACIRPNHRTQADWPLAVDLTGTRADLAACWTR